MTILKRKGIMMNTKWHGLMILLVLAAAMGWSDTDTSVVTDGAKVEKLAGGFAFTEGPAADAQGNVYFSDIPNNRILKWSLDGKLSTFRENSGGANGLYFDKDGNLLACEGGGRRLVSIDQKGDVTVLADMYQGKKFNSLNDLWIDPKGGVYFTDPRYGNRDGMEQDGEHVYYLAPDLKKLIRVIDDMVRPNGLIGTPDGVTLYVTDNGDGKTFAYKIEQDGTLSGKKLFAPEGSDGMTIDNEGNIYLTAGGVAVYNKNGEKIEEIKIPEGPANVTFGGSDNQTLFITARTSLYSVRMRVKGAEREKKFKYEELTICTVETVIKTPLLTGMPLPELEKMGIELPDGASEKMILVCLWDMEQRPSRHCIRQLAEEAEDLAKKGVTVVSVQTSDVDDKTLGEWLKENKIPFANGRTAAEVGKSTFNWGVKSMPWLILTDNQHIVRAESFGIEELDEAIKTITSKDSIQSLSPDDIQQVRDFFHEMSQSLRTSAFHLEYKIDKYPLNEEYFPGGNIDKAIKSQDPDSPVLSQWIASMRRSYSHDITLDLSKPYYFAQKFSYDLGDDQRKNLKGEDISSFDGKLNYYYETRDKIGTIATDEAGRIPPPNPIGIYTDTATVMGDADRYALVSSPPALCEEVDVSNDGSLWLFEFRDTKETEGYRSHQLLVHISDRKILRDRIFSGRSENDRSLQKQYLFERFGAYDLAGIKLHQTVIENGFLTQGSGLDNKEVVFAEQKIFTIRNVGPAKLTEKDSFSYPFVAGTQVWVKDEDYSYYAEPDGRPVPKAPSLVGKTLPELKDLKIDLAADVDNKMILVCFWDMNQRPSRYFITQLAGQTDELKKKSVTVVAVQASKVDEEMLNEWTKKNNIPFAVGIVQGDEQKTRFAWGVRLLPWLILTDRRHIVIKEGFALSDLNEQILQAGTEPKFEEDIIKTSTGDLKITFIGHATLMFTFGGKTIHVDPVTAEADYTDMPKADIILLTHEHGDHFDTKAIEMLRKQGTQLVLTKACAEKVAGLVMANGNVQTVQGLKIEAVPAYNIVHERSAGNPFHPKGRGNGYIITFGDKRVYIAGDTENTPEMKQLKNIDVAFLPMNLPYTMTPEMVADAAKAFKPKILYPYHYSQTDPNKLVELLKDSKGIEVRIRKMR
jgi:gluconolactonase